MPSAWELEREVADLQARLGVAQKWLRDMEAELAARPVKYVERKVPVDRIVERAVYVDRPVDRVVRVEVPVADPKLVGQIRGKLVRELRQRITELERQAGELHAVDDFPLRTRNDGLPFLLAPRNHIEKERIRHVLECA